MTVDAAGVVVNQSQGDLVQQDFDYFVYTQATKDWAPKATFSRTELAPTLSNQGIVGVPGETTVDPIVTTSKFDGVQAGWAQGGTVYSMALLASAPAPSHADIVAGTGAEGDGGVSAPAAQTIVALPQITGLIGTTTSAEVGAVFARMSALTQTESDAIEVFVDGMVADGVWTKVTEFYAPCLNATDHLTGFLASSLLVTGTPTHVPGDWLSFTNLNQYLLEDRVYDSFAQLDSFAGAYVEFTAVDTTSNSDYFGIATGTEEAYYRWRGSDTLDSNAVWEVTSATPRAVLTKKPNQTFMGVGLEGTTISELDQGVLENTTRVRGANVPATHPFQWFGQNIDGTPSLGTKVVSNYACMLHMNGQTQAEILTTWTRVHQFLIDIGVNGVPNP